MSRRTDNERLLADVMAGEPDAAFHQALLDETLRLARRCRHYGQARRTVATVAVLAGLSVLVWQSLSPRIVSPRLDKGHYTIVRTVPLPETALVTTQPFARDLLVASVATANVIETTPTSGPFREISDDELLAMVAPKVAALVRLGPHEVELVVLEPTAENTAPPN